MCASTAGLSSFCIVLLFMHGEGLVVSLTVGLGCISSHSIKTDLGEMEEANLYSVLAPS